MIVLNEDWTFTSKGGTSLGYVGENEVCTLKIQKLGTEYLDWDIVLDVSQPGKKNIWAVEKTEEAGNMVLSVLIKREYIAAAGSITIQLRATHADGRVKKSAQLTLSVSPSINAPDVVPSPLPSEFAEYELRILDVKEAVEADADRAAKAALCSPQIGENGNWYTWNSTTGELSDTGIPASGNAEWNFFGTTPCRVSGPSISGVKMVSSTECSYRLYSDTVKDMDSAGRTMNWLTESHSNGVYEFTVSIVNNKPSGWYQVFWSMKFTGLEIGKAYKLYIDTTGLTPDSTTTGMHFGRFLLASVNNGSKGDLLINTTEVDHARLSSWEFIATTPDVLLEYYAGKEISELVNGYQVRFKDLYINYADAESGHTPILNQSGSFTGELVFPEYTDKLHYESTPSCSVYYSEAKSKLFTINGKGPDASGNIEIPVSRLQSRTLACFGDSITGDFQPPMDYPSVIAKLTGMQVYNLGVGGCRMSQHTDQYYDAFSMYRLVDAITSGDYTLQEAAVGHTVNYAADRIASLKSIDWTKIDYVTILFGTNDIHGGVSLDHADAPKDVTTYLGAVRYSLKVLWSRYPHLRVLLLTPIYRYWDNEQVDSDEKMFGNKHFYEYGNALLQLAKNYKTPVLNLYDTLGINKWNRRQYFSNGDGTHPNDLGRALLGEKIAGKLLGDF
ncbi:SGNH/GDSL hydrolase family protein [Anaeromassilibacillus senegalensis]|uniref:SGNH/GDSL hydrolase family protein n=1 Tax=Anaeromassilibacillus senegalensis TaxID=1673717 RepID=UPI000681D9BA|nr:SGNH/GDSL hydrolase family protein [Anaeromassilibacillus senegalensis]